MFIRIIKQRIMKTKIELKRINGEIFFSHECEDNSVAKTIEALRTSGKEFDLHCADLWKADLRNAYLRNADLSYADLSCADLRKADLRNADLRNADLSCADLSCADLSNIDVSEKTAFLLQQCPSEGSFVAWKKAGGMIVKLLVTEDAKRSSATTLKCRCSKAKVLAIENLDGSESELKEVESSYDSNFVYRVGETVEVENFDDNRWNECSSGIHFFIAREMAVKY